jgi:hypothetical protein
VIEGPIVRTGREVDDAALLVGRDADDAMMLPGDAEVLVLAGPGIVDEDITPRIVGAFLALFGIALLGADVKLAAGSDVVARVDLRLGSEPPGPLSRSPRERRGPS